MKDALSGVHPVSLVGHRFLISALCLAPWVARKPRPSRHLRSGFLLSLLLLLLYITQTWGMLYTSAANSGFITGLFVLFVPILLHVLFRKPPRPLHWAAVAIAVAGLWFLTGGLRAVNRGDALTLVAAFAYAAHLLCLDRIVKGTVDILLLTFHQFWMTGVFCTLLSLAAGFPLGVSDTRAAGIIVFLALFPTLTGFFVQAIAQRHTPPLKVSLIFSTEPVFAALFAWTLGGETFHISSALGGALIVVAMVVAEMARSAPGDRP